MTPIPFQSVVREPNYRSPADQKPGTGGHGGALRRGGPRWLLAVRVQLLMTGQPGLLPAHRERLHESAVRLGFMPIHAASIIAIAERSVQRGGLDHQASIEIAAVPCPEPQALFKLGIALRMVIAGLLVVAGAVVLVRWI